MFVCSVRHTKCHLSTKNNTKRWTKSKESKTIQIIRSSLHMYAHISETLEPALSHTHREYMRFHTQLQMQAVCVYWILSARTTTFKPARERQQLRCPNCVDACDVTIVASKQASKQANEGKNPTAKNNFKVCLQFEFGAAAAVAVATASCIKYCCCCCYVEPALHCCSNHSNMCFVAL